MNDQEFLKLNNQIKAKQAQVANQRERQSAANLSENCTTHLSELRKNTQKSACQRCRQTGPDLVEIPEGRYRLLCHACNEARLKWVDKQARQECRRRREEKQTLLSKRLRQTIPRALLKARLARLGSRFKERLLRYNPATGLVLYGPTGTGKTWALCALLRSLIASGLRCKRIGYEMLCLHIRDSFKSKSEKSELDVLKEYVEADVLLLEDIGCSKPIGSVESEFSLRVIYVLLEARLENERLTLVSTNKTLGNMRVDFDERIASRLSAFTWIGVSGKDKRAVAKEL